MSLAVILAFFGICILGVPLAFAFGISGLIGLSIAGQPFELMASRMMFAINKFPLLAIPFFMLAGELMVRGGIVTVAIRFANTLVGNVRGGLGYVTIGSGVGLASVSGTAIADAAALGSALMRPLGRDYGRPFGAALIAACGNLGPILPPSTAMIVYASIAGPGLSLPALFLAGILPGLLIAALMAVYVRIVAVRRGFPVSGQTFRGRAVLVEGLRALPVLLMPVIVIGGIVGGVFTATEGGAIAVVLALLLGFFFTRQLKISDIPGALLQAGLTTGTVTVIIAFASTVTFLFTIDRLPNQLSTLIQAITTDPEIFLLLIFAVLLVVGMFLESTAAYVMLVPIFAPMAVIYGIEPLHFALVFILTLILGMLTPPVGTLLFLMCSLTGLKLGQIVAEIWPYVLIVGAVIVMAIFLPSLFLFLPRAMGY